MDESAANILEQWKSESIYANCSIVEILESFLSFAKVMRKTLDVMSKASSDTKRDLIKSCGMIAIDYTEERWQPILDEARELLKKENFDSTPKELLEKVEKDLQQE